MQFQQNAGMKRRFVGSSGLIKKKKKIEDDTVTLIFSNLPPGASDKALNDFVIGSDLNVKIKACRANYHKRIACVDFNFWEVKRVLKLNNVEWMGENISVQVDGEDLLQQYEQEHEAEDNEPRFTLFCKNLSYLASEQEIARLFKGVKEVRLVRDKTSQKSKGFAYIDFKSRFALEAAHKLMGTLKFRGRKLWLDIFEAKSQKPEYTGEETAPSKTLFVRGVAKSMDKDSFLKNFEGSTDVRIMKESNTAYINFESEKAAQTAYELGQGISDVSTTLQVQYMKDIENDPISSNHSSKPDTENGPSYKLLCRNLPFEVSEQEVAGLFYDVKDIEFVRSKTTNKFRGLAYVHFDSKEALEEAIESHSRVVLHGRKLFLKMCAESAQKPVCTAPDKTLVVRGLTANMDSKTLMKHFPGALDAQVIHVGDGKEKIGYVAYETEEAAKQANEECGGEKEIIGSVYVQFVKENVNERTVLCVRGITDSITEDALKKSFDGCIDSYIVQDNQTGRKRVGYLKFSTEAEAEKIYKMSKEGWNVNGVDLWVAFAKRHVQSKTVIAQNVASNIDEGMMLQAFKGAVEVRIPLDNHLGSRKGFAFIEFASELDALRTCLASRSGVEIDGTVLTIYASKNKKRVPIRASTTKSQRPMKRRLY